MSRSPLRTRGTRPSVFSLSAIVLLCLLVMLGLVTIGCGGDDDATATTAAAEAGRRAVDALHAGCDLLISTGTLEQHVAMIGAIVEAVASGDLPAERLDQAVLRILRLKSQQRLLSR